MPASRPPILVADKNPDVRRHLCEAARSCGLEPCEAAHLDEAVRVAAERKVRFAFVDVLLPGGGGYRTAEALANLDPPPGVALMAGAFEPVDEDRARRAGASDVLLKPLGDAEIVAVLERRLGADAGAPLDVPEPEPGPPGDDGPLELGVTDVPQERVPLPGDPDFSLPVGVAEAGFEEAVRKAVRSELDRRLPSLVRRIVREELDRRAGGGSPGARDRTIGEGPPCP
ncbi:MAG: DUF2497 domain-containing protein [Acidobacteria bacterium]|nr:MAG: DUF2497 domain-containing protein [Acidobacteriota bacterium]